MIIENSPLVSVVIACYNHENFVQDCINSIINQTYQNIELIIIDDGSSDSSVEKINELLGVCYERFVRFEFRHRSNRGLTSTLNEALIWCRGEYYCPFASDDIMLKNKTAIQVNYLLKEVDIIAIFGGVNFINNNGEFLRNWPIFLKKYIFNDILLHNHNLPAPTQMIRMECIRKIGTYNKDVVIEDWYMYLKLSKIGPILSIPDILCEYRAHDNNFSKNLSKLHQGRLQVLSYFDNEVNYHKALEKILFMNALELAKKNGYVDVLEVIKVGFKYPLFFLNFLFNKFKVNS